MTPTEILRAHLARFDTRRNANAPVLAGRSVVALSGPQPRQRPKKTPGAAAGSKS